MQLVDKALEELGLAPYNFDIQPEKKDSIALTMDAMIAEWVGKGLQIGYNMGGKIDDPSGVAASRNRAVYLQLAIAIAPSVGKTVSRDTTTAAELAMDSLWIVAAQPLERQFPAGTPRGAGQKAWRGTADPFFPAPDFQPLVADQTDNLEIAKD